MASDQAPDSMTPERWQQIKSVYEQVDSAEPSKRPELLDQLCAGDSDLRARVEELIQTSGTWTSYRELLGAAAAELNPPMDLEAPGTWIGPYQLGTVLGSGGMGVVYRAEQLQPIRRTVALKIVKPGMDSRQVIARFETERQALALMDHPNIARVLDAGATSNGRPYFVMELVEGIAITRFCDEKRFSPRQRLELFLPVCEAIQHAHQKGIIHRDIKPSNILVTEVDGKAIAKVIDFGIAKATASEPGEATATILTNVGTVVGSIDYMSPEQADFRSDIDTRSDVYSLGVVLYELLTGDTPINRADFAHATYLELLRRIREDEPVKPSARLKSAAHTLTAISEMRRTDPGRLTKTIQGELDWIVMKSLEKDRTRRYQTANGLARDVERYLAGEPVEAGPPSATYRVMKMARKHRVAIATAAAFLALVIAAAIFSTREAIRARRAEQVAEAVNNFLQNDLLAQASSSRQGGPDTKPDPDIKVRTALDRAAANVGATFKGQPEVEAAVRRTIGTTYLDLGLTAPARQQLDRAVEILRSSKGPLDRETLATENQLVSADLLEGRFPAAEARAKQTLAQQTSAFGNADHDTLETMDNLAQTYAKEGKLPEAEKTARELVALHARSGVDTRESLNAQLSLAGLLRDEGKPADAEAIDTKALEVLRRTLGAEHPMTITAMSNLAEDYSRGGKYAESEALFQQNLEIRKRILGADHPDTVAAINNLASAYWLDGKYPQAEQMYRIAVDGFTRLKGPDHPDTLEAIHNLASTLYYETRYDEAVVLSKQVFDKLMPTLGPEHQFTIGAGVLLASEYSRQEGKLPQAEALLNQLVGPAKKGLGPTHPVTLSLMNNLSIIYKRENKLPEAEKLQTEVVNGNLANLGPEHPSTLSASINLALWKLLQHKDSEAAELLQSLIAVYERKYPESWQRFRCEHLLGSALTSLKRYAEAEAHLLKAFPGLVARQAKIPADGLVNIPDSVKNLVKLYQSWGKPEQAAEWEAKGKDPAVASLAKR